MACVRMCVSGIAVLVKRFSGGKSRVLVVFDIRVLSYCCAALTDVHGCVLGKGVTPRAECRTLVLNQVQRCSSHDVEIAHECNGKGRRPLKADSFRSTCPPLLDS